jgi:hypothetical protein
MHANIRITIYSLALALTGLASAPLPAEEPKETKPAAKPEFKLPPGWTEADMQACIAAGTPGKMHELLANGLGTWEGKATQWMSPDADPVTSESKAVVTSLMDGRFTRCEISGEIPGMGPYKGIGIYGYDNVAQKFQCTWFDNHGTGMMLGTGEASSDGKTITWTFSFSCPITKKPAVMREVETITGEDTKSLEMFGADPKTGKEYKMMSITLSRKSGTVKEAVKVSR